MAKPKTVTPPPPSSGQDYIEMDRIPPRRGNPKEAQRTIAIVAGALVILAVGVGLRETVYKPRFTTVAVPESAETTASSKETVTDIPTGFTQGPMPIRVRTPAAKAGKSGGAPVPSPFGRPGTTSAANTGAASDGDTAATGATVGPGGYDPFGAVRSAASQPTVSLTPRNNDTDTTSATSPYTPSTTTPQTGSGYTPAYTAPSYGASGSTAGTTGTGRGLGTGYGSGSTGGFGAGTGSSYGTSGSGTGTAGSNTSSGGIYTSPYGSSPYGSGTGTSGGTGTGTTSAGTTGGSFYGSPR